MAFPRIEFENPADGFDGAGGMQGGEHQVAGLGGFHAGFHGFAVANFPEQDDVGCFTEDVLEALAVGVDVAADFLLGDDAG